MTPDELALEQWADDGGPDWTPSREYRPGDRFEYRGETHKITSQPFYEPLPTHVRENVYNQTPLQSFRIGATFEILARDADDAMHILRSSLLGLEDDAYIKHVWTDREINPFTP